MEQLEKISPAFYETPTAQMSSKEFQRMLYTWCEEKGLVADLRSYLRVLMINKLRNTTVGKIDYNKTSNFSLSKQAFGLVIAEHLLREGCHYTLSIFSTEVPGVANQLPFSLFEAHCREDTWRFDQDSVLNVLELIGISKNSRESLRISALYFKNYGSLLTCMVGSKTVESVQESQKIENLGDEDIGDYLNRVLGAVGVPSNVINELKKTIEQNVKKDVEANNLQLQKHFGKKVEELKTQVAAKNEQIKQMIDEQVTQKQEKKKLKSDLKDTRKRLNQMILQEKSLKLKEEQIREQLNEIAELQKGLKDSFNKDKAEMLKDCPQKHCTESCKNNLQSIEDLQKEIVKMQEINKDKNLETERLNSKINTLLRDLQNSQLKNEFLNSCLLHYNQINLQENLGEVHVELSDETLDSLTEEILKDVRSKLLELERESDELSIRLKKIKTK